MTGILSPAVPADVPGEGPPQMPLAGDQTGTGRVVIGLTALDMSVLATAASGSCSPAPTSSLAASPRSPNPAPW